MGPFNVTAGKVDGSLERSFPIDDDTHTAVKIRAFNGRIDAASPFSDADRRAADAWWAPIATANPDLFDGPVLLSVDTWMEKGVLRARFAELNFSLLHWWRSTSPPRGIRNVFGAAVVVSSDGAVLLGRMAAHTAAPGKIYFPCGSVDASDVNDSGIDLDKSLRRELEEETGLFDDLTPSEARLAVFTPKNAVYARRLDTKLTASELACRVKDHLSRDPKPELDRILFVRSPDELTAASPSYVRLVLEGLFGRG